MLQNLGNKETAAAVEVVVRPMHFVLDRVIKDCLMLYRKSNAA
jgi:hypothetical protein